MVGQDDRRERIIREIIKILPDVAKTLKQAFAAHGSLKLPPGSHLTTAEMRVLIHLAEYGAQTMSELAQGMKMTRASATSLVRPLVALGLVRRSRDLRDGRVVRVELTDHAKEVADRVVLSLRAEIEAVLTGVDTDKCAVFLECLERFAGSGKGEASEKPEVKES